MKYLSIAIVIIFVAVIIGFWIKKAPQPEVVAPTVEEKVVEPVKQETTDQTEGNKKIIKTTTIQGMKIETTKEGSGVEINDGQMAVVNYTGKLTNGNVFDSNVDPKFGHVAPFSFQVGNEGPGGVIKGWNIGVKGMKVGEKRTLTIPADLGYGALGAGDVIPPNATLVFEVELLGIK